MSVETFYYCADLERALRWWQQPASETSAELLNWSPALDIPHPWLISRDEITDELVPGIEELMQSSPGATSLSDVSLMAVSDFIVQEGRKARSIVATINDWVGPIRTERHEDRLVYVASFYELLVEASARGPANDPVNSHVTDLYLSEFLQRYLDQDQADQYDLSSMDNKEGFCVPPALTKLERHFLQAIQTRAGFAYFLNAREWLSRWKKLESLNGMWDQLASEVGEKPVTHLRAIADIAEYAVQNQLTMLKKNI